MFGGTLAVGAATLFLEICQDLHPGRRWAIKFSRSTIALDSLLDQTVVGDRPLQATLALGAYGENLQKTLLIILLTPPRRRLAYREVRIRNAGREGLARSRAMTADDLADLLGVSRLTILRRAKRGTIPSFRVGACIRFDPANIAEWLVNMGVKLMTK